MREVLMYKGLPLEFVGGGPLDGLRRACPSGVVRVALRRAGEAPISHDATLDLIVRRPHHVYRVARAACDQGCCEELVMDYQGMEGPDSPPQTEISA